MNRFGDLRDVKKRAAEPAAPAEAPTPLPAEPPSPAPVKERPKGKKKDPTYTQVTAYIPKALYKRVDLALREAEPRGQFSALVEKLLTDWLDPPKDTPKSN